MKAGTVATHLCAGVALGYALRAATFGRSWLRVPVVRHMPDAPLISIVVPARNEERSIERCVRSLLVQTAPHVEVIVVDDRSSDTTPEILERLARENARLLVVRGAPLPQGWVGKPWALHQGSQVARGRWLLFTDADSEHAPFSVTSVLAFARSTASDAVTISTHQELGSLAERIVLPSILGLIFFASGTFATLNDPARPERALANGQYIFIARRAYDALGGHESVRDRIVEDVELARRIKRDGRFRLTIAGGEELARVRMYHSLREIWDGFTKNVYFGAEGRADRLILGLAFMSAISLLPPVLAINALAKRRPFEAAEALAASAATMASAAWAIDAVRLDRRLGWFQPLGTAVMAAITINSTARILSGRGVEWRGRRYEGGSGGAATTRRIDCE
ncbi:MAG: glycosyltransferase family 2 protein [Candidatus Velthaea sp.]